MKRDKEICSILVHPANFDKISIKSNHYVDINTVIMIPNRYYGPYIKTEKDLFREIRTLRKLVKSLRR